MKHPLKVCVVCALTFAVVACASRPAPGISGHWTPVDRYAQRPQEIPLYPSHEFYAAPLDRTLKTMLARWARDSKLALNYQHGSDFTLFEPVSRIRTPELQQALAQLSALYAEQQVEIALIDGAIVVRRANSTQPAAADPTAHGPVAPATASTGAAPAGFPSRADIQ
jgi:hypothetical protein